jgi:hypothetical protein
MSGPAFIAEIVNAEDYRDMIGESGRRTFDSIDERRSPWKYLVSQKRKYN